MTWRQPLPHRRLNPNKVTDPALACVWSGRHQMPPESVVANPMRRRYKDGPYGTLITFACQQCSSLRLDVYDTKGDLNGRRYKLSDEYRYVRTLVRKGKIKRPEVTLEVIRRIRADHATRQEKKVAKAGRRRLRAVS